MSRAYNGQRDFASVQVLASLEVPGWHRHLTVAGGRIRTQAADGPPRKDLTEFQFLSRLTTTIGHGDCGTWSSKANLRMLFPMAARTTKPACSTELIPWARASSLRPPSRRSSGGRMEEGGGFFLCCERESQSPRYLVCNSFAHFGQRIQPPAQLTNIQTNIARHCDTCIILRDLGDTRKMLEELQDFGITGKHIKLQSACHNKGILIDSKRMLVGSHNYSGAGT